MRLLARHASDDLVCFGGLGPRRAAQLSALSLSIADELPHPVKGAGALVACRDRYFFMAALLGALQRGYRVLLPPNGQPETIRDLARAASVLLHDVDGGDGLDVRLLDSGQVRAGESLRADLAELPLVLFTSGSTGAPEPHEKALGLLMSEAEAHLQEFGLAGGRVVAGVPPHHIYGLLFSVLVPLLGGGSALRSTPLFPRELSGALFEHAADVLVSVPPQLSALAEDRDLLLPELRRVFCSAGPLDGRAANKLASRGVAITEILGSTETGGIAYRERPGAVWTPLRAVSVSVAADGVLCVDAPWLPADLTRPLRTADRAELEGPGFRHLGRADAVTKVAGRRVDLGDVEACLRGVPGVRDARVLAVEGKGVRGLTLWAVVESPVAQPRERLRTALNAHFDPVTVPKRFRTVRSLPRNESGKVTRAALLALFDTWELVFESRPDGDVDIKVPDNFGFFRGHFARDPILPGVVQLRHVALTQTRRRFPELRALTRVTRVKFKRMVLPGEALTLTLQRKGPLQVQFAMRVGAEPACSGIFHFREPLLAEVP